MAKKDFVFGFMACAAVAAAAPVAMLLAAGPGRRPLVRALVRGGSVLSEKTRETFAELQEITEDLVAEMRAPTESMDTGAAVAAADEPDANGHAEEPEEPAAKKPRARRRPARRRSPAAA